MSETTSPDLMPAAFLGHGNPMNALADNRYTQAWHALGRAVPRPRAILVISAHWYINATAVTAMPRPRTIHDFYGFPQPLFDVQYPAPGLPSFVEEVSDVVHPTWVGADVDSWGIDHGTWSVLMHAFPDADVPVMQLSINADKPFDYHLDLGARLAPLREQRRADHRQRQRRAQPRRDECGPARRRLRLGAALRRAGQGRRWPTSRTETAALDGHRDFRTAVPTPDHYIPLLYLAGLAGAADRGADVLVDGYAYGSLSMTAYTLDLACPGAGDGTEPAAALPDGVPPDGTNI